jgi:hypothetical protein
MTETVSFTRYENVIYPGFRQRVQRAESTGDVKSLFAFATRDMLQSAFEGKMSFRDDDIKLLPESESRFAISDRLRSSATFKSVWKNSDLRRVIERFAGLSIGRCKRLQKHPEKTDAKIRM